ncbi:MAG: hypothetical protein U7123_22945 [Potamolinea sp.]
MSNNDSVLCAFLKVFNDNPAIFDQDLQDLDQTLTDLENQPIDKLEQELIAWYQDEKRWDKIGVPISEVARRPNETLKEIKRVPPSNPSDDDTPIINRYRELRESVKERLKAQPQTSENKPSGDEKLSK